MGFTPDQLRPAAVTVWPGNAASWEVFTSLMTQWRVGPNGATGLDYNVLPFALRMNGAPRKDWPRLFADVRVMEGAVLDYIRSL